MHKTLPFLLFFVVSFCNAQYTWTRRADFNGKRYAPYTFSINDKMYVGAGRDSADNIYRDLWKFDPQLNTWTQMASLPAGMERHGAGALVISGKAYIVSGWTKNTSPLELQDVWEYNPVTDTFIRKNDLPGTFTGRYEYASFTIGNKGYLGTGYGPYRKDFASYDPTTDTWTKLADIPGPARQVPSFFAIGNYGYLGFGDDDSQPLYFKDFYKYDPSNNTWTTLPTFPGDARGGANCFTLNGKGYMVGGFNYPVTASPIIQKQVWEFNPTNNGWTQLSNLPDTIADGCSGATSSNGYVGLGNKGITGYNSNLHNNRFWQFGYPLGVEALNKTKLTLFIYAEKKVELQFEEPTKAKGDLILVNMNGQVVYKSTIAVNTEKEAIDLSGLNSGIYIINYSSPDFKYSNKIAFTR